jgi:hypothetical protein
MHWWVCGVSSSGFWVVTPYSLIECTEVSEERTASIVRVINYIVFAVSTWLFDPEYGGSMLFRNFSKLLPKYAVSHLRR